MISSDKNPRNWSVAEFLQRFQTALEYGPPLRWDEAPRRMQELADLRFERSDVLRELRKLTPAAHHKGPEPDDAMPDGGTVHVFCHKLDAGIEVYVKLSLRVFDKKPDQVFPMIWSFKRWA